MSKIKEIIAAIEAVAPPGLAEGWDNCGLQFGHPDAVVRRVMVALDPTAEAVMEASRYGAGLLVTHHPFFFGPVKSLILDSGQGLALAQAVRAGVAVYSAHTSFDRANPGVSDSLADVLGLLNRSPLERAEGFPEGFGLGRVGDLPEDMTVGDAAQVMKDDLGCISVRLVGDPDRVVRRVAVCGGSGGRFIESAVAAGAGLYITGDVKYHEALRAAEAGLCVLDVGHYHSERHALPLLARLLSERLGEAGIDMDVAVSGLKAEPWTDI